MYCGGVQFTPVAIICGDSDTALMHSEKDSPLLISFSFRQLNVIQEAESGNSKSNSKIASASIRQGIVSNAMMSGFAAVSISSFLR